MTVLAKISSNLADGPAEVIQNHENESGGGIGKGEARHRKNSWLELDGGQAYDRSSE
jgi:hypothetical protein